MKPSIPAAFAHFLIIRRALTTERRSEVYMCPTAAYPAE